MSEIRLSPWKDYPENKPDIPTDTTRWYWVKLRNGTVHMACWWSPVWYCFPYAHDVIAFSELTEV